MCSSDLGLPDPMPEKPARGSTSRAPRRKPDDTGRNPETGLAATTGSTPLRIPYGNKEAAFKLGARYGARGWYAPAGIDLAPFRDKGWL